MITVSLGGIGRAGNVGGVWHYVMEGLEWVEFTVGHGIEILWVRIKEQTNNEDVIVKIFYRPSSQDHDTDELFFEEHL